MKDDEWKSIAWAVIAIVSLPLLIIALPLYGIYQLISIAAEHVAIRRHQRIKAGSALVLDEDKFKAEVIRAYGELKRTHQHPCFSIIEEFFAISVALAPSVREPSQTDLAVDAIAQSFAAFTGTLPPAALQSLEQVIREDDKPLFSVSLIDFLPSAGRSVEELVFPFFASKLIAADLFAALRKRLDDNQHEATGGKSKLIMPSDSPLPPDRLVKAYLRGTPFQSLFTAAIPFAIPAELRFQGHWICGTQGSGKSTLLKALFLADLKAVETNNASIIIMDSSGDFLNYAAGLKLFAKHQPLEGKLVVLTPDKDFPLALNPLDIGASAAHTIDLLEYIFASLRDTKNTALQSTLFRSVFLALQAVPNASLSTFRSFLTDGWRAYEDAISTLHPDDRDFFFKGEYDSKPYRDTTGQILWRLRDLTTRVPLLREMFNSSTTKVNIGNLMDTSKVICINNSRDLLGDTGSEFFARYFLALIRAAADQRSKLRDHEKVPVYIYLDECQNIIANDENVEKIIAECRKQKIALILSHQFWSQIRNDSVKSALANCAIRFANVDEEASQLAPRFRTEPEALQLPRGSFAAFIRTKTEKAITLKVPLPPDMERMTKAEADLIQQQMRATYCIDNNRPAPAQRIPSSLSPAPVNHEEKSEWD
jgi:hypothetical protein